MGSLIQRKNEITGMPGYDAMVLAIDQCYAIDEAKELRDQAKALEVYAKEALNIYAERKAVEIRIRAERKAGQLLKDMQKGKGGGDRKSDHSERPAPSDFAEAKQKSNISDDQAKRWQQLADIEPEVFEERLATPYALPSTTGLINASNNKDENGDGTRQAPDDSLMLWGALCDFEKFGYLNMDINELVAEMSPVLQKQTRRVVPMIIEWLKTLEENNGERRQDN